VYYINYFTNFNLDLQIREKGTGKLVVSGVHAFSNAGRPLTGVGKMKL
jgi:hypothetical protein